MRHLEGTTAKRGSRLLAGGILLALLAASSSTLSHSQVATALDQQAAKEAIARLEAIHKDPKRLAEAETEGKRLLKSLEESLGPDSPEAIEVAGRLVRILMESGKFRLPEALKLAERAMASAERSFPEGDLRLAQPLKDLGDVLGYIGSLTEGRDAHLRWLAIMEAQKGPLDPSTANALSALGSDSRQLGDYSAARLYYDRALAIYDSRLADADWGEVSGLLSSLTYTCLPDDPDQALAYAVRAVGMLDERSPLQRSWYHRMLTTLADVYGELGRLEEAIPLLDRTIAFYREWMGEENGEVAFRLSNQAVLMSRLGRGDSALAQADRALRMQTKLVPVDDRTLVMFLRNLAQVHIAAGMDAQARPLLERAVRLRVRAYGAHHDSVAPLLDLLSRVEFRLGEESAAMEHALGAEWIARQGFQDIASILSERQAYRFETRRAGSLQVVLSLLSRRPGRAPADLVARAWDEVVRSRALVLDELSSRHRAAALVEGPEIEALSRDLKRAKSRLAALALQGAGPSLAAPADDLTEAQARKDSLERELTRRSVEYRRRLAQWNTGFSTVRNALPSGAALLAYVQYERLSAARAVPQASEPHYAALLLAAASTQPAFIPLGPATAIDEAVRRWKEQAGSSPTRLPTLPEGDEPGGAQAGRLLRELIWDPVSRELRGINSLFVVPDGALQLVNLAALPAAVDRYLVETGPLIHYLSTERDLVRQGAQRYAGNGVLILGDPDLDARRFSASGSTRSPAASASPSGPVPGAAPACDGFRSLRFEPLAATREEVKDVKALLGGNASIVDLTGPAATESAFKSLAPGRRILHIATHGFFLQDRCESALSSARARGTAAVAPRGAPLRLLGDNPLLLSGLTLAGANRRGEPGAAAGVDDGILTAEEVGSLDLSGVEWAVLSACETGVGKVLPGEGVLGLRRAFAVAGAGTLIMSLWRVDDEATREWMGNLYRGRLDGLSTAEAVREASRAMIRDRREKGKTTHPYFWGGFVAEGDWR